MNKIVSNFYLIRLDGEPVYVGYTNRTIKQRFSEHKKDKDFGDIEPSVESLGNLKYDFTWDMELINQYAKEVSDKETELILSYNTQDSVWQKGTSGNIGGQTWNNVKNFIRTNQDNPIFRELEESDIMVLLEWQRINYKKLHHMVHHTNIKGAHKLERMVNNTKVMGAQKLQSVVSNTKVRGARKLENMIGDTKVKGAQKLTSMVSTTKTRESIKLNKMINHTNVKGYQKLTSMVNHTKAKSLDIDK